MSGDDLRQRLSDPPLRVLNRLPFAPGKLMIVAQNDGVTHERIGNIERVEKQADRVFCIGQAHNLQHRSGVPYRRLSDRSHGTNEGQGPPQA